MPSGRAVFREVRDSRPETDLLRAARYFYRLKCSTFGQAHSWLNAPMPRALGRRLVAFRRLPASAVTAAALTAYLTDRGFPPRT